MGWLWLITCCLVASVGVSASIRKLWLSIPLSCFAGPALFLLGIATVGDGLGALDGIVMLTGQVAALPISVVVAAVFRARRGWAAP